MVRIDPIFPQSVRAELLSTLNLEGQEDYFFEYLRHGTRTRVYGFYNKKLGWRPSRKQLEQYQYYAEAVDYWKSLIKCQKRPFYTLAYGTALISYLREPSLQETKFTQLPAGHLTKGYLMCLYEYSEYKKRTGFIMPQPIPNALAGFLPNRDPATGYIIIADSDVRDLPDLIEILDTNGQALKSASCPHLDPHRLYIVGPASDGYFPGWKYGYGCQYWGQVLAIDLPNLQPLVIAHDFRIQRTDTDGYYYPQHPNHFSFSYETISDGFHKCTYIGPYSCFTVEITNLTCSIPEIEILLENKYTEEQTEARKQAINTRFEAEKTDLLEKYQEKLDNLEKKYQAELGKIEKWKERQIRYLNDRNRDEMARRSLAYLQALAEINHQYNAKIAELESSGLGKIITKTAEERDKKLAELEDWKEKQLAKAGTYYERHIQDPEKARVGSFKILVVVKRSTGDFFNFHFLWGREYVATCYPEAVEVGDTMLSFLVSYKSYKNFTIEIIQKQEAPGEEVIQLIQELWSYGEPPTEKTLIHSETWSS